MLLATYTMSSRIIIIKWPQGQVSEFMKMMYLKVFSMLLLAVLAGCSSDVKDVNDENDSSTFRLSKVELVSFQTYSSNSSWPELKDNAIVDLRACLLDRVYIEAIVGVEFQIEGYSGESKAVSDVNGCITWKETIQYDSTADETFYKVNGNILGEKKYKGAQNFRLAINPWNRKIVDLNKGGSVKKLSYLDSSKTKSIQNQIILKDINFSLVDLDFSARETFLSLKTFLTPLLARQGLDGVKQYDALTGGHFQLKFALIQKELGKGERRLIAQTESTSFINEKGVLEANISFVIEDKIDYQAKLELLVEATPIEAPVSLASYSGFVTLDSLTEENTLKLKDMPLNFSSFVNLAENNTAHNNFTKKEEPRMTHGFIIDEIKANSSISDGEANLVAHNTARERRAVIELSLIDSLVFKGINSNFEVEILDLKEDKIIYSQVKSTRQREGSGKILITPNFAYDETYEYDYRDFLITIKGTKAPFRDIKHEVLVYVNPRVQGAGMLLDSRDHKRPEVNLENKPQIYFNEYQFDFISNDDSSAYKINKNLDILTSRVVRLRVFPKLKMAHRYDDASRGYPAIQSGEFKVSLMVLTPKNPLLQSYNRKVDLNDFYMLTGDEKIVQVENGELSADMRLVHLFDEKQLLSFKNIAVLKIESTDPQSAYAPGYLIGQVEMLKKYGVVRALSDTKLKSETQIELDHANQTLSDEFSKRIKSLDNKLISDVHIGDRYEMFKRELLLNFKAGSVPVIDHDQYKIVEKQTNFHISDSEEEFLKKFPDVNMSKDEIEDFIVTQKISTEKLKNLCALFYDKKQKTTVYYHSGRPEVGYNFPSVVQHTGLDYKRCKNDPLAHINFRELRFIETITTQPGELERVTGEQTVMESTKIQTRNDAFFVSKGETFSYMRGLRNSHSVGFSAHATLDISSKIMGGPLGFFLSAGPEANIRDDYFDMDSQNSMVSDQRRIINQDGQNFIVSNLKVKFEARFKKCLMITPKYVLADIPRRDVHSGSALKELISWFKKEETRKFVTSEKRHLVCSEYSRRNELEEQWFFVRLAKNASDTNNDYAMAPNFVGSTIRGETSYDQFRLMDLENDKKIIVNMNSNEKVVKKYKNYIDNQGKVIRYKDRLGIGYPGLYEPYYGYLDYLQEKND